MPIQRTQYLLKQYLDHRITEDELAELFILLEEEGTTEALEAIITQTPEAAAYREEAWEPLFQRILEKSGAAEVRRARVIPWRRWAAVAAVLLLLAGAGW